MIAGALGATEIAGIVSHVLSSPRAGRAYSHTSQASTRNTPESSPVATGDAGAG